MFKITKRWYDGEYDYCLTSPRHPRGTQAYHRVLMENKLGRLLRRNEVVHHKNGVKTDNRLSNLQLMTASQHNKHHHPVLQLIKLRCGHCKKIVALQPHVLRQRQKRSKGKLYCSKRCGNLERWSK